MIQPHLKLSSTDVGEYVLLPGDPGRCEIIAGYLTDPVFVANNREFTTWNGTLDGVTVTVTSTGIGGPSTAIAVEELVRCGAKTLIRVGTAGAMQSFMQHGDLVVVNGAIRDGGTSLAFLPPEFPALAHQDVINALVAGAREAAPRVNTLIGVTHEKDAYYGQQHDARTSPRGTALQERWDQWVAGGALCSEMESATLFILGSVLGVRTGGLMVTGGHPENRPNSEEARARFSLDNLARAAIAGLETLIRFDACGYPQACGRIEEAVFLT